MRVLHGKLTEARSEVESANLSTRDKELSHQDEIARLVSNLCVLLLTYNIWSVIHCCYEKLLFQKAESSRALDDLAEKHKHAEKSNQDKIKELEAEMRLILHQSEQLRTESESRMNKLAGALGEFTQLLRIPQ